jgi:hypothetical protein
VRSAFSIVCIETPAKLLTCSSKSPEQIPIVALRRRGCATGFSLSLPKRAL